MYASIIYFVTKKERFRIGNLNKAFFCQNFSGIFYEKQATPQK